MADPKEILVKNYDSLRNEMVEADKLNYQIMLFIFTACGAILAYCLSNKEKYFGILTIYIILFLGYKLLLSNRKKIWRISAYLSEYIEPKVEEIKWETGLNQLMTSSSIRGNEFNVINSIAWGSFLLLLLKFILYKENEIGEREQTLYSLIITLLASIIISFWSWRMLNNYKRMGKIHLELINKWRKAVS